jgi:hypothetical protein
MGRSGPGETEIPEAMTMTNPTDVPRRRHWPRRTIVLASTTLVVSLSASPVAHADGLLDGATQVVGGVTDPVVTPPVEAVQSAVPQPVPQPVPHAVPHAVEPVVEDVVEPAVSDVQQTGKPAQQGAGRAVQPVVKTVEPVVRHADEPGGQPTAAPVERPAAGTVAPAPAPSAAHGAGTPTSNDAVDVSSHEGADGAATTGRPRDGQRPSGADSCNSATDLPPRGMATLAFQPPSDGHDETSAEQALWNLTNALMHTWDDDTWRSTDVGSPDRRLADVPWFDVPGDGANGVPAIGGSDMVPVLLGLLGLLGLLVAGVSLAQSRQPEWSRRETT